MRVHHLNCGAHCPLGGAFYDGASKGLLADIPTHCLLIETGAELVLVDTGYGLQDVRRPRCPPGLSIYQHIMDTDRPARRRNQQCLRDLKAAEGKAVKVFCSHDAAELAALQAP